MKDAYSEIARIDAQVRDKLVQRADREVTDSRNAVALHSPQRMAERIAELVHASPVTALHTARTLRTATDAKGRRLNLWPQPGSGARITSFTPSHMVNLLLALGAGDPIRSSQIVAEFRSLSHPGTAVWVHVKDEPLNALMDREGSQETITRFTDKEPLLHGPTLGDDLDFIIETLASTDESDERREYLRLAKVILALAPSRAARILIPMGTGLTHQVAYAGEQTAASSALYRVLEGSTEETMGAMEALAIIWRENQAALRPPTKETAALHPCQGMNAAAPSQPPATERERGRQTPPVLPVRESALNGYAAGPPFTMERPDARSRQLPADSAGC